MRRFIAASIMACGLALVATPAVAECRLWDLSGYSLALDQSNGMSSYFDIVQNGRELRGRASYLALKEVKVLGMIVDFEDEDRVGEVEGTLTGSTAKFRVRWRDRTGYAQAPIGVYELRIDENGYVEGTTYDFEKPTSRANVLGRSNLKCADVAEAPPPPPPEPPKTVRAIGSATAAPPTTIDRAGPVTVTADPQSPNLFDIRTVPVEEPTREPK